MTMLPVPAVGCISCHLPCCQCLPVPRFVATCLPAAHACHEVDLVPPACSSSWSGPVSCACPWTLRCFWLPVPVCPLWFPGPVCLSSPAYLSPRLIACGGAVHSPSTASGSCARTACWPAAATPPCGCALLLARAVRRAIHGGACPPRRPWRVAAPAAAARPRLPRRLGARRRRRRGGPCWRAAPFGGTRASGAPPPRHPPGGGGGVWRPRLHPASAAMRRCVKASTDSSFLCWCPSPLYVGCWLCMVGTLVYACGDAIVSIRRVGWSPSWPPSVVLFQTEKTVLVIPRPCTRRTSGTDPDDQCPAAVTEVPASHLIPASRPPHRAADSVIAAW